MRPAATIDDLLEIARALGDLRDEVVFTGGAVLPLLVTDAASPPARETYDVDIYVRRGTLARYHAVLDALKRHHFRPASDGPVCRWERGELVVDVMSDEEHSLGFTNRWYRSAAEGALVIVIGDIEVQLISAPYFIATKLEAFADPHRENAGDLHASRDVEDIVTLVDGRPEIVAEICSAPEELRDYLRARVQPLLAEESFHTAVNGHLAGDAARTRIVLDRLRDALK